MHIQKSVYMPFIHDQKGGSDGNPHLVWIIFLSLSSLISDKRIESKLCEEVGKVEELLL